MMSCPDAWTPEQITLMQVPFDTILAGNTWLKSRVRVRTGRG
jgi:hypothetical protein